MGLLPTIKYVYYNMRDGSAYHLWYVYLIIGLYLFIPVIWKFIKLATEKEILYFLCIWMIMMIINQPIFKMFKSPLVLIYFSDYLGYLVLGYYLYVKSFSNKIILPAIITILLGNIVIFFGTYYLCTQSGDLVQYFYENLTPHIFLIASSVFILLRKTNAPKSKVIQNLRDFIATHSYGIYLAHVMVLNSFYKICLSGDIIHPIIGIPITVLCCLSVSGLLVFFIKKLPYGAYISG